MGHFYLHLAYACTVSRPSPLDEVQHMSRSSPLFHPSSTNVVAIQLRSLVIDYPYL